MTRRMIFPNGLSMTSRSAPLVPVVLPPWPSAAWRASPPTMAYRSAFAAKPTRATRSIHGAAADATPPVPVLNALDVTVFTPPLRSFALGAPPRRLRIEKQHGVFDDGQLAPIL